jgi:hypothetical protein
VSHTAFGSENLAVLGSASFRLFEQAIQGLGTPEAHQAELLKAHFSFTQEFQRFRIWAVDIGLLAPGHGSLDYRLRDSEKLEGAFEAYLHDLNEDLQQTLDFTDPARSDSQGSTADPPHAASSLQGSDNVAEVGSEDDEEEDLLSYIDILLASVVDILDGLFKLSTIIRNPATRLLSSKANSFRQIDPDSRIELIDAFGHCDHDYVLSATYQYQSQFPQRLRGEQNLQLKHRFPQSHQWHKTAECNLCQARRLDLGNVESSEPEEPETNERWPEAEESVEYLVHRISRAIGQRRRYLAYWKHHRAKLEAHTANALATPLTDKPSEIVSAEPVQPSAQTVGARQLKLTELLAPLTVTTATQLRPSPMVNMQEGSETSVSEYAASDWEPGHEELPFPPPPNVPPLDKFFVCPYCFTVCPRKMATEKAWKYARPSALSKAITDHVGHT